MPDKNSTTYINSTVYKDLEDKLKELVQSIDDNVTRITASRELRYADVDIEAEREAGRLAPDELYVPQHIIDTNIRREQAPYVQYITQSPRAVITRNIDDSAQDMSLLDTDITNRLRYEGWQLPMFANVDGFQANGYSVMEVVMDTSRPGHVAHEYVQYCDFAYKTDTQDIQAVEMTCRCHYFTKTRLVDLCGDPERPNPDSDWDRDQVEKIIGQQPVPNTSQSADNKDVSLYKVFKYMFKVSGTVNVAWGVPDKCSDWVRKPRPLFLGRKKLVESQPQGNMALLNPIQQIQPQIQIQDVYETKYPYILFPYLISENNTISHLKGRIFLDQDLQEAVSSLVSSTVTQARRAAGLYFSKETSDPNDDVLLQKNIYLKQGCLINSKVSSMKLEAPDPGMFSAIQMLVSANQNETSQVNFAVNNRKDSRKTAREIATAEQQQQSLSTVQVVLYAISLTQMYRLMVDIIKSKVLCGIIVVPPAIKDLYQKNFILKPSGDTDVIEKQQLIQKMMMSWQVVSQTAAAPLFMMDLLELMFPDRAAKYNAAIQQQLQQSQSQQAQQQQYFMSIAMGMAKGIIKLSKHKEFFSDIGQLHAFPQIEMAAEQLEELGKQMSQPKQVPQQAMIQ